MASTKNTKLSPGQLLARGRAEDVTLRAKPRRRGLILAAVVTMLVCGLIATLLVSHAAHRESVIGVSKTVAAGHTITRDDLVAMQIAGLEGTYRVDQVQQVVGKVAAVDLVPGSALTSRMVTTESVPGAGRASVGLSLTAAQMPTGGLGAGSPVDVIQVAGSSDQGNSTTVTPEVLSSDATVYSIGGSTTTAQDGTSDQSNGGTAVSVTIIVDSADATKIAAAASAGRVALVATSPADQSGSKK